MKRILIIGTSGSGKSTLSKQLSERLGLPFHASDHFYWEPGWKPSSSEKVRRQILNVIDREEWILDGNFDSERDLVWKQADCIIWLDYPLTTILPRIILRNFHWLLTRRITWSGNRMTLRRAISGIRHAISSYSTKKQNYPCWLSEISGITLYHFHTSRETETWFQGLDAHRK